MFVHDSPVALGQWSPVLGFLFVMMFTFSVHSYDRQVCVCVPCQEGDEGRDGRQRQAARERGGKEDEFTRFWKQKEVYSFELGVVKSLLRASGSGA